jgi:hypothetical protein
MAGEPGHISGELTFEVQEMGEIDTQELEKNLEELQSIPVPVKRAAFSDWTAWIMAILAGNRKGYTRPQ